LVIEQAVTWPNPGPRYLSVRMAGPADRLRFKVYSPAWVLVSEAEFGPQSKGWNQLDLTDRKDRFPAGLFYFVVEAEGQGRRAQAFKGTGYQWPR
jgi:hypothetical protein